MIIGGANALRCAICDRVLVGRYHVGPEGETYCPGHETEPACDFCFRIISKRSTGGGMSYPDGRRCCNRCFGTAIIDPADGQVVVDRVVTYFAAAGITIADSIPVRLVDRAEIDRVGGLGPTAQGVTRWEVDHVSTRVDQIAILRGVPAELFGAIAAHEFAHAWMVLHKFPMLDAPVCEGFCELFAFLWLRDRGGGDASRLLRVQMDSPDPVYGDGFRAVLDVYQRVGLPVLVNHLGQHGQLP